MIWDGTSPLRPEHEVAYRGWPTERVEFYDERYPELYPLRSGRDGKYHQKNGRFIDDLEDHHFDLIPLQKEPGNE